MKLIVAALTAGALLATPALAAPCRDARGKFTKCPMTVKAKAITNTKTTVTATGGKCRDAKGHFAKCGTAGAHPAK